MTGASAGASSIPLLDVTLAIMRRFTRNQPIFSADRGHIHHRLIDRGLTPRRAVLVLYLVCAMAAGFALLLTTPHAGRYFGVVMLAVCGVVWLGIRQLRYAEFGLASRLPFGGELQRTLGGQLRLERLAEDLLPSQRRSSIWLEAGVEGGQGFRLRLDAPGCRWAGRRPVSRRRTDSANECWSFRVPFRRWRYYFELTRCRSNPGIAADDGGSCFWTRLRQGAGEQAGGMGSAGGGAAIGWNLLACQRLLKESLR